MRANTVVEQLEALRKHRAALLATALNSLSHKELLEVLACDEQSGWSAPTALHPILNRLARECSPHELGGTSMGDLLSRRLRISRSVATQRLRDAEMLGPRTGLTGESLQPLWVGTAAGQAEGEIGPEQLAIIRAFHRKLSSRVDYQTRDAAEDALASIAREHLPKEVQASADLLLQCLNPDGDFSDQDRQQSRWIRIGKQEADGMSKISGYITPELRAMIEAVLAVCATYGKYNPDTPDPARADPDQATLDDALADFAAAHAHLNPDPEADTDLAADTEPAEDSTPADTDPAGGIADEVRTPGPAKPTMAPTAEPTMADGLADLLAGVTPEDQRWAETRQRMADDPQHRDSRSQAQRNHDAFTHVFRTILSLHTLPTTRGAPTTVVLTFGAGQLLDGTGHVVTATGTKLPWSDAIRMAKTSYPVLAVFDDHSGQPLYLGRTRRIATYWQWLALFARDRGCSRPGCTIAAAHCEIHHHDEWAARQGNTDVDKMSLNCTCDHRLLSLGFTTSMGADGRVIWAPPPYLNGGHARVNNYWFPENYLLNAETKRAQRDPPAQEDTG